MTLVVSKLALYKCKRKKNIMVSNLAIFFKKHGFEKKAL